MLISLDDTDATTSSALGSAICSNIDKRTLQETQARLQRLHSSRMYCSLSQVAAHARLQQLDDEAGAKLQKVKTHLETTIKHLTRYPLDGLPPPTNNDPRLKDAENVGSYVETTEAWLAQMRASVDEMEEKVRRAEDAQRRVEEENRRIEEEQKRAATEAQTLRVAQKWVPITSTRKTMVEIEETVGKLEDRVTDLEYEFLHMRENTPSAGDVVFQRLVELGFCKSTDALSDVLARQKSLEEGEMPFEPPSRPKSNEELTDECKRLEKLLKGYTAVVQHGQQQLTELQERRVTRDRSYHELAADNASLALTIKEVRLGYIFIFVIGFC